MYLQQIYNTPFIYPNTKQYRVKMQTTNTRDYLIMDWGDAVYSLVINPLLYTLRSGRTVKFFVVEKIAFFIT